MTNKSIIIAGNTLGKDERLKSRKLIADLFSKGRAINAFPLRALYILSSPEGPLLQAGFSVGSRNFKKATDRNRIKRLMRECYRTQKQPLAMLTEEKNIRLSVFFIFTGKEIPDYNLMKEKMLSAITQLAKNIRQT